MESTGESADDHGSGWLLVKKKHRSSSKFSLHGWVGGLSGKQASGVLPSRPASNAKGGSSNISLGGQPSKARENSVVHGSSVANSPNARNEDETDVQYLDKCVVSQRSQCSESSVQSTVSVSKSVCETGHLDEVSRNGNSDTLPKIKWGNLDDGALILNSRNVNGMELRFGGIGIGTDYLVPMKDGITDNTVSCTSACEEIKDNKLVVASIEADEIIQESSSLSPKNEPVNETHEEVKEVSLEDVKVRIASEKMVYPSGDVSCYNEAANAHTKETSDNLLGSSGQSGEYILSAGFGETVITAEINEPSDSHETRHSKTSEVPDVCGDVSIVVVSVDSEIAPHENSRLDDQREFTAMALSDDSGDPQDASMADEFSNMQAMSSNVVGDAGESKERFRQRLWCFLFENLNRAVDELYLLCELECDLEQMKEAMLVLEEAECDFKELKSRVEEFEKVKRSSQLSDGVPKTLKSEHRRPHALSWEVRRMTTSPHRAEILSSSLEAFRRIQQERTIKHGVNDSGKVGLDDPNPHRPSSDILKKHAGGSDVVMDAKEPVVKSRKPSGVSVLAQGSSSREKRNVDSGRSIRINSAQYGRLTVQNQSASSSSVSTATLKDSPAVKSKREVLGSSGEKVVPKKDKLLTEGSLDKNVKCVDNLKRQSLPSERFERDMEKKNDSNGILFRSMDAWKQKRNWEDILAFPLRSSSRFSHSPGMSRKSAERARILRDKLMSPEKKKKTSVDMKKEAEEKHARALRIRSELENERVQKLQRSSEKLNRVNEWQAVRSSRLREGMHARHQRSESRYEAHLAQVVRRAGDESSKVNEVRFITSLNEENRKLMFLQKHQESELRRAEKLKDMKTKQKEDMAREEAVLERKKLIEAEKLQRLAEIQRRKEEAQLRREEERKASSAAREAKAMEQMRRKEFRAKAQQEEAELLAQKLAERLSESEQRRKFYLEQIRERASMDHRDQTSPLPRRLVNKETHGRLTSANSGEDDYVNNTPGIGGAILPGSNLVLQHSLKRRIKKIRQRLMALKYELPELSLSVENTGIGYRAAVGTARAKISRWLQELQRHRLARKEGAASIGLVTAEMIKFMEGKDPELQASRQAGLLDFIASALPASHTTKLEACQVTMYLLRLLRVVLSLPSNRSYFIAQNLLPPIIPMLAAALENFIKIAASTSVPGSTSLTSSKSCMENLDSISEVLDGFLWTVAAIIGHMNSDERQLQMQEGLLELVVSYQVIHRLRDLFALYDRPQVEGSPFPSSILLSINLLVILTSKFRAESSIDWENFPIEVMPVKIEQKTNHVEVANLVASSLYDDLNGNYKVSSSTVSGGVPLLLEDKPEDQSLDQSCYIKNGNESILLHKKECAADESRSSLREDIAKPSISKKDEKNSVDVSAEQMTGQGSRLKQPVACLLSAISETGLVCLPSLLTAVLLQANNRLSYEQASYALPSNFEEVAAGVLKVLNNLALIDITFIQRMLARADLKMELFHIMSFLLSHCTSKWGATTDQIGLLLLECLLLLGYFAMFHPENQAVLRWGKSPTILHKVCDLPFVFFSDPELMPVLAGTLVAACFGCEQNRGVVQQELSTDMLISLLRSCRTGLVSTRSISAHDNPPIDESTELNQLVPESKKLQGEIPRRSDRLKSTRGQPVKGSSSINNTRSVKIRNPKDGKAMKLSEDIVVKHNLSTSGTYSNLMLHSRFTGSFIDKAEQFFSAELPAHVEI